MVVERAGIPAGERRTLQIIWINFTQKILQDRAWPVWDHQLRYYQREERVPERKLFLASSMKDFFKSLEFYDNKEEAVHSSKDRGRGWMQQHLKLKVNWAGGGKEISGDCGAGKDKVGVAGYMY